AAAAIVSAIRSGPMPAPPMPMRPRPAFQGSALATPRTPNEISAAGKRCDERVAFLLSRTLAAGVDARAGGVTDPQYDFVRPRRVVDQHRGRIEGIQIPTLVQRPIDQIDGRAWRAHLGVARNDNATAFDRAAHRHSESRMYHGSAMFEVASD